MRRAPLGWLWDNIEAFAVAIAMALVIRHYCIEAFRIPTGSMLPTLRGDDPARRVGGDRILVDKTSWEFREPRRYEVAVFRYPLNTNKNFIKRIAGLPGEWLRLADGDIWTSSDKGKSWAIARKPKGVRESLFFPYWPEPVDNRGAFENITCWECTGGCATSDAKELEFRPEGGEGRMIFLPRLFPYSDVDTDTREGRAEQEKQGWKQSVSVGDARISFECDVKEAGTLEVHIVEHGRKHRLVLDAKSSFAEIAGPEPHRVPLKTLLEAGTKIDVSFANVDDTLVVDLPDDGLIEIPFPEAPKEPPTAAAVAAAEDWGVHEISLTARGLAATLSDVRIDRDVFYDAGQGRTPRTSYDEGVHRDLRKSDAEEDVHEWRIPDDCFFMMGDNTQSSSDSRVWKVHQVRLKDGTLLEWYPGPTEDNDPRKVMNNSVEGEPWGRGPGGEIMRLAADVDGLVRYFPALAVAERARDVPRQFVPRENLVGRAFAVFWPIHLPRLSLGPTRVKLIR